jgi:hypothetical protein
VGCWLLAYRDKGRHCLGLSCCLMSVGPGKAKIFWPRRLWWMMHGAAYLRRMTADMAAPHMGVGGRRTDADMPKGAAVEWPR